MNVKSRRVVFYKVDLLCLCEGVANGASLCLQSRGTYPHPLSSPTQPCTPLRGLLQAVPAPAQRASSCGESNVRYLYHCTFFLVNNQVFVGIRQKMSTSFTIPKKTFIPKYCVFNSGIKLEAGLKIDKKSLPLKKHQKSQF